VPYGPRDAKAFQAGIANVAQLNRFVASGARPAGNHRPCPSRAAAGHLDLNRRTATAVEHLAGVDVFDLRH
jgi:hypothetical protein